MAKIVGAIIAFLIIISFPIWGSILLIMIAKVIEYWKLLLGLFVSAIALGLINPALENKRNKRQSRGIMDKLLNKFVESGLSDEQVNYRNHFAKKGLSVEHADEALKEDIQGRKNYRELFAKKGLSQEQADRAFESSIESQYLTHNTEENRKDFREDFLKDGMSVEQADKAHNELVKTLEARLEIFKETRQAQ